ncbi:uncharacterized mitochondrial protein AtMg00860-like [Glycine max]|uniref:uncharacterized mitochondrial protein AtMg00860-like n=1 Tax=Glycine max TaxID=3847 RepID=UPI0007191BD7|nr:uncharacterized mitochondrial protein AtMg00860-like [Glycine max]|eukprot:XP_014633589.1 uncharacterized protein LOC106799475 [Glycine max]
MGIASVSSKVQAIQDWPMPQSVRAIRSFLGLASFHRHFVCGYASIVPPLIKATTLDSFQWTPDTQNAFCRLKEALRKALVLSLPDFEVPFTVETYASYSGTSRNYLLSSSL